MKREIVPFLAAFLLLASCSVDNTTSSSNPEKEVDIDRSVPPNPVEEPNADGIVVSHAISLRSEPKYPADFPHFDYVNPEAPKGGTLTVAATGTFDTFHRYGQRGDSAPASSAFYDSLMVVGADEIEVYYGLISEKVEYPITYDWIIFHLRPEARFQDGKPILAEDVVFSFNKFLTEGVPQFKKNFGPVESVEALDARRVKFSLNESNKEMLVDLAQLTILPPQYWRNLDFREPTTEIPLGSGAYTVSDYAMGQYVIYERLKDYWALGLPVIKGTLNFDYVRYDMYRDAAVQLEALKAGEVDLRVENSSRQWATQYGGPNLDAGYIVKDEIPDNNPPGLQAFAFNNEREVFSDRRVREAIGLVMDFEWMNRNLFYGQYSRSRSYFQSTPFEALGLPSPEELAILKPIRNQLPPEVFEKEYQPPVSDGSGRIRERISQAIELLDASGWEVQDQRMVNKASGKPFAFELLIYSSTAERLAIPFQENLKKLGIDMSIRLVDTTQYINRYREGDYDMVTAIFGGDYFPDSSLRLEWHSDYIDDTYNTARVQNSAIDYLVEGIIDHQNNNTVLLHWARALDRVLQWNHYSIPQWHVDYYRVAYWDKFGMPETRPRYSLGTDTWWLDTQKAAKLPDYQNR